jgi:hypothetical protein
VISAAYEQQLLADLLTHLNDTIQSPSSPGTVFVPRYPLRLKGLRPLSTIKH